MPIPDSFKRALGEESARRRITFGLLALTLVSVLAWAWAVRRAAVQAPVAEVPMPAPVTARLPEAAELGRWLGAAPAAGEPSPSQRFQLLGVIAAASGRGAALIAVDGQPARPFGVGAQVAPGFVLQRLASREVTLGESLDGPAKLTLPLPEWQPRSGAAGEGAAPAPPEAGPVPPSESTAVQPGPRGDQRAP